MSQLNLNAEQLGHKMNTLTKELKDKTTNAVDEGKESLGAASGANTLQVAFNEKKEIAVAWAKENPLAAAAIGVGVGFILGGLVRRMMNRRE
ncbi:MAG: hypothetical protein H7301_02360 [Cryobacterium sp.]|nr:hypothetical protein [Oligoflexia bacterium]